MSSQRSLEYTPVDALDGIHKTARTAFASGRTRSIDFRQQQLSQLAYLISDNHSAIVRAIKQDLGRCEFESDVLEVNPTLKEVYTAYKNVAKWAKPEYAPFSLVYGPMRPHIRKEPQGTVLIIAPFNYPLFLTIGPLCGAIAAGCAAVVKPSELTPVTSILLAELFPKYLDTELYPIVNGAIPETTRLLELRWDHISPVMYTGGERVAKIVSKAAAEYLTPVSLELGGKSPVVVDPKCNVKSAARKIWWGKMNNAGQTCIAPDYVIVPKHFQDELVAAFKEVQAEFFPTAPHETPDFARIVSPGHFNRIRGLLEKTEGTVVFGGADQCQEAIKYIAPSLVADCSGDDSLMSEEIFGPVLPIVPVANVDEAIEFINAREHPLALYVFSQDSKFKQKVFDNTQSGSAVANEVVVQVAVDDTPFGGVGTSGHGSWTGKYGFDSFSHHRTSIDSPVWMDYLMKFRNPPYTDGKLALINTLTKPPLPPRVGDTSWDHWKTVASGLVLAVGSMIAARKAV